MSWNATGAYVHLFLFFSHRLQTVWENSVREPESEVQCGVYTLCELSMDKKALYYKLISR